METIYQSPIMDKLIDRVFMGAKSSAPAFITGEQGTGKEHIASMLHENGPRDKKPFVAVNCAAIPETLIEAELFGSKRGAYTSSVETRQGLFRQADQGTIFLDELAEMPIAVQSKLLRVIQDRQARALGDNDSYDVTCRIIAATNRPIAESLANHKLRPDLYHRLAVVTLHVPPLRERKEDVQPLAEYFIKKFSAEEGRTITFDTTIFDYLRSLEWEGNVRQLQNTIHRAIIFSKNSHLTVADLAHEILLLNKSEMAATIGSPETTLEDVEKAKILNTLKLTNYNRVDAARRLGIGRQTLYNKIKLYGIEIGKRGDVKKVLTIPQTTDNVTT